MREEGGVPAVVGLWRGKDSAWACKSGAATT